MAIIAKNAFYYTSYICILLRIIKVHKLNRIEAELYQIAFSSNQVEINKKMALAKKKKTDQMI